MLSTCAAQWLAVRRNAHKLPRTALQWAAWQGVPARDMWVSGTRACRRRRTASHACSAAARAGALRAVPSDVFKSTNNTSHATYHSRASGGRCFRRPIHSLVAEPALLHMPCASEHSRSFALQGRKRRTHGKASTPGLQYTAHSQSWAGKLQNAGRKSGYTAVDQAGIGA